MGKTIERFAKSGKALAIGAAMAAGVAGLYGCSDGKNEPVPNYDPDTKIGVNFDDNLNGNVLYLLTGTDPNGNNTIDKISASVNGGSWNDYTNGEVIMALILEQNNNTIEAKAYDSQGAVDPTPVFNAFTPATEDEARTKIEELLDARRYTLSSSLDPMTYSRDQVFGVSSSCGGNIVADYLITRGNGSRVVIEYIGENDNPSTELDEKSNLECEGVPHLYMRSLPVSEVENRFESFADGNGNL